MSAGIYRGIVVPHAPRLAPKVLPDFQKDLIAGMVELGKDIRADKPDVMIVNSAHYISTFNWHACMVPDHKGYCVSMEAPDLIGGEYYHYKGDPELGAAIRDEIRGLGLPCAEHESEHYTWDYGTWVPVQYLDPDAEIPIIIIPVVLAANIDESFAVGRALHRACAKAGRRAVLAASCSFSHALERGPEIWPTNERQARDHEFIAMLLEGRIEDAWAGYKEYAQFVVGEMGGRNIALLLGGLIESGAQRFDTAQYGPYAQSSGSGNANVSLKAAA